MVPSEDNEEKKMAKLVEVLARELSEWPEDDTAGYCVQSNETVDVFFGGPAKNLLLSELAEDRFEARVAREMWQSERDRQKGGEWKRHRGGKQPVHGVLVERRLRCGDTQIESADSFLWEHAKCDSYAQIMAYRVLEKPEQEEKEVERKGEAATLEYQICGEGEEPKPDAWQTIGGNPQNIGTITYTIDLNTEPAIQKIEELQAKWDQFDGPLKWRDGVAELDAYIEEFTREREALINRLAEEGFALLPAMTPVMGVSDVDMSDPRKWKSGDLITYIHRSDSCFTNGKQYTLDLVRHEMAEVETDDEGDANGWSVDYFKWHSRP